METFSEETLAKARTAKIYIEHLYKVQSQNVKERRDRWAPARGLLCSRSHPYHFAAQAACWSQLH